MDYGVITYDFLQERYDITFNNGENYGGLHCGNIFEVLTDGKWIPTRIEYNDDWYLVGIDNKISLYGLSVRI